MKKKSYEKVNERNERKSKKRKGKSEVRERIEQEKVGKN